MVGVWDRVHPQHVHRCSKMGRGANVSQSFSMIQRDCNKLENPAEETPAVQQEKMESPVFEPVAKHWLRFSTEEAESLS